MYLLKEKKRKEKIIIKEIDLLKPWGLHWGEFYTMWVHIGGYLLRKNMT